MTKLSAQYKLITPKIAKDMLIYCPNETFYRTRSNSKVKQWIKELELGEWIPTTQGVGFDINGDMVDGQHRLTAIEQSGISATLLVCRGLPVSSVNKIDVGRKRTLQDLTGLSSTVIATVRVPFRAILTTQTGHNLSSLTFMRDYFNGELGRLAKELSYITKSTTGVLNVGVRAGIIMSIMSGTVTEEQGIETFSDLYELRQNSKGTWVNDFDHREEVRKTLPRLLKSLIEKIETNVVPVQDDKTGLYSDQQDVREKASKLMFLSMQALDPATNKKSYFSTPSRDVVERLLKI